MKAYLLVFGAAYTLGALTVYSLGSRAVVESKNDRANVVSQPKNAAHALTSVMSSEQHQPTINFSTISPVVAKVFGPQSPLSDNYAFNGIPTCSEPITDGRFANASIATGGGATVVSLLSTQSLLSTFEQPAGQLVVLTQGAEGHGVRLTLTGTRDGAIQVGGNQIRTISSSNGEISFTGTDNLGFDRRELRTVTEQPQEPSESNSDSTNPDSENE